MKGLKSKMVLRTWMQSMDIFSHALLEDYNDKLDTYGQAYLQRMRSLTEHLIEITDKWLELLRVTGIEIDFVTLNLSKLAQTIARELHKTEPKRQVEFVIAEEVLANGEEQLLWVVLDTLLSRAWTSTRKRVHAKIEFGQTQFGKQLVYFVRDNGTGIKILDTNLSFNAFQRLQTITEFSGIGIGLVTVQQLVQFHGGRLWAESFSEYSTTFYFTLSPLSQK